MFFLILAIVLLPVSRRTRCLVLFYLLVVFICSSRTTWCLTSFPMLTWICIVFGEVSAEDFDHFLIGLFVFLIAEF
jgi:hypothetical protein